MTPYYSDNLVTLYHGDCREVLPALHTLGSMALADPPYGETSIEWDRWPDGWIHGTSAALLPSAPIWCFGSMRMFLAHRAEFVGWRFVQEIVWEKHNGSGFMVDRFRRVHELAAQFVRSEAAWEEVYKSPQFTADATRRTVRRKSKPAHWTGAHSASSYESKDGGPRLMRSVIHVRSEHGRALHPTQKPIGILQPLIEYSCPPTGTVVVPFAGAGSELLAAKLCGRKAIGVEAREEFCEAAASRLAQGVLSFGALA